MRYQENAKIKLTQCDETGYIKPSAVIDIMMDVSNNQLHAKDAGIEDLYKQNLGWVVTQYHFDYIKTPKGGQNVIVSTEAMGYNRFFEYRNYYIQDEAGNYLIKVSSQWVIIDLKQRKIVSPDPKMMKRFGSPLLTKMPKFVRLKPLEKYDFQRQYRVQYEDLDTNCHMTNAHYLNWLMDILDRGFLNQHQIQSIDLKFDHEIIYGQKPKVSLKKDGNISYHKISVDDKTVAVAKINWK